LHLKISAIFCKNIRIIGGNDGDIQEFPYHASLMRISDNEHICNGAIISNLHILTTAHCVDIGFIIYSNLKIRIGISRRSSLRGSMLLPQRIFTHPMYTRKLNSRTHKLYNIAIIKVCYQINNNIYILTLLKNCYIINITIPFK
jgi:hypothetical protein